MSTQCITFIFDPSINIVGHIVVSVLKSKCYNVSRLGDLLCCETCSAVYHLGCVDPPLAFVPEDDWHCAVCIKNKVTKYKSCRS